MAMADFQNLAGPILLICFALLLSPNIADLNDWEISQEFYYPWLARNEATYPREYDYVFSHDEDDPEYRLDYFREDMMLNSHHYQFHNANPFEWTPRAGKYIDRKGELFYYLHQQALARYDSARLSCGFNRTIPFHNLREPMKEGYFPIFPPRTTGMQFPGRKPYTLLKDITDTTVDDLERWRARVLEAIEDGFVTKPNGRRVSLLGSNGIDLLGAMLQSTTTSINRDKYGNLHNMGHSMIAHVNDPKERTDMDPGVMEKAPTTVRDPLFYRWHKEIDNIMNFYKCKLRPYTYSELCWPAVKMLGISVHGRVTDTDNKLTTYTQRQKAYLKTGFDTFSRIPIVVNFKILQHEEFEYKIPVDVEGYQNVRGVVRIFLAPAVDEYGHEIPLHVQRRHYFELDRFQVDLKPGRQTILRHSEDSHVTQPMKRSLKTLAMGLPESVYNGQLGCGWPHHLLLPKGRKDGMPFVLFAMITNWEDDRADPDRDEDFLGAVCYCGTFEKLYPDKRNMGFPFDRKIREGTTLASFLKPNMAATLIEIYHSNQLVSEGAQFDPDFHQTRLPSSGQYDTRYGEA